VARLSALRTGRLYPWKYPWYSFLLKAESTPGPYCGRKDYVNKNFQWHRRESKAVPQPTALPCAPVSTGNRVQHIYVPRSGNKLPIICLVFVPCIFFLRLWTTSECTKFLQFIILFFCSYVFRHVCVVIRELFHVCWVAYESNEMVDKTPHYTWSCVCYVEGWYAPICLVTLPSEYAPWWWHVRVETCRSGRIK
jgi:hypothetical protein